jgi:hypothetical protein
VKLAAELEAVQEPTPATRVMEQSGLDAPAEAATVTVPVDSSGDRSTLNSSCEPVPGAGLTLRLIVAVTRETSTVTAALLLLA